MNILRLHRTLWLLLFLAVLPAAAQEYAFRTFTVHDGLISNYVTTLEQDSRGYLWIGTDEGFSIYDGHHFMNVHPPEGMVWGYVNRFLELPSSPGTMLIATNGSGIVRYDGNFSAPLLLDSIESSNRVNDLYEDETGTLWCATDNGLYRVRNGVPQRIAVPSLSARALIQISPASSGTAWITSPTALLSVDLRTDRVRVVLRTNIEGTNDQIVPMPDGEHTVMTTRNALLLFRKDSIVQRLEFREGEYGNTILDTNGDLWIGGTKRVVRAGLRRGKLIVLGDYDRGNGVPVNDVSCLKGDRENNLWFGTPGKGLVRLHDHENFLLRFNGSTSRGTAESRSGLWMPTLSGLYNISGDTPGALQQRRFTFRQDLLPIAVQVSSNGLLWCTTYGEGLSVYRMKQSNGRVTALEPVRHWRRSNLFPGVYTTILFLDSRQRLWCSTDSGGVMIVDTRHPGSSPRLLDRFPGTEDLNIAAFAETPDGRVLAGGNGSPVLLEFSEEQGRMQVHRVYRFGDSISNAGIRSLAVTQEGSMWIGTRYDGLLRRRPDGTVRKYGYADGLHSQQILSLFVDGNALWIGTQSGMEYVPDIAAPRFVRSTELTGSPVYTIGRFSGASVWGMTRYEVVVNDPQALTIPKITPPLYLTSFLVNGIPQGDEEPEILRTELISCSFSFTCVTFRGNADVKYQYRLDGLHTDWQPLTSERSMTFAQLGAGRFTFHVRGVLDNGTVLTETVTRSFMVVPPLWDRWWFTPLLLLLVLSGVAGAYNFRIRQRLALERVRLSIAADLHDDIGSVLARIANLADILVMSGTAVRKRSASPRTTKRGLPQQSAQTIADLSRELLEKMSDVVWSVDPRNDDPRRLLQRVQTYCTEFAEHHHLTLRFDISGEFQRFHIDPQRSRAVLLVVKEALTNVLKHSEADSIDISLAVMSDALSVSVTDNGKGFDERSVGRVNGIYNMRKRAEMCRGSVTVTSSAGTGTTVTMTIPL